MQLGAPVVHCKAFQDYSGALELARLPKMRPGTRPTNVKYHQFQEVVAKGRIKVQHMLSKEQLDNTLRKKYMVW
jgi:hypothetical protein